MQAFPLISSSKLTLTKESGCLACPSCHMALGGEGGPATLYSDTYVYILVMFTMCRIQQWITTVHITSEQ